MDSSFPTFGYSSSKSTGAKGLRPNANLDASRSIELVKIFPVGIANVRLGVAILVSGTNLQRVRHSVCDVPVKGEWRPDHGSRLRGQSRQLPRSAGINPNFHLSDLTLSGPGD